MTGKPTAAHAETLRGLLDAAGRKSASVPLRRAFVQGGDQRTPKPGPLAQIVRRHDDMALDLFLVGLALASKAPWDVVRDARVWARAVGHGTDKDLGRSMVSKAWNRLDTTYGLVCRERSGRLAKITYLAEDGTREPYSAPERHYTRLPFAYWTDTDEAWHHTLSLPAKAMLLISLTLQPGFKLPADRAPQWYGISSDTADRGLRELRDRGALERRFHTVQDWTLPSGQYTVYTFRLKAPFARPNAAASDPAPTLEGTPRPAMGTTSSSLFVPPAAVAPATLAGGKVTS